MNRRLLPACVILFACNAGPVAQNAGSEPTATGADAQGLGEVTLEDVQRALAAGRATWSAGETSVSALPRDVWHEMLGVPLSDLPQDPVRVLVADPSEDAEALPAIHDWRDVGGKSFLSPVLDQGRCGSCVAFAAVATFESQLNIAANDASSPWQLSAQYLFACGGGACNWGWQVGPAARYLVKKGIPDYACMPYTSGAHNDDAECRDACGDASKRLRKANDYGSPTKSGSAVTAVKNALMRGPLMATMTVYDDFMYYTDGVYRHTTGGVAGGHAVSIVGWNDDHDSWIVRNSWGEGWGMRGFFEIARDDASGVGDQTWSLEVAPPGPYVSLPGVRDRTILSGTAYPLELNAVSLTGAQLSWSLSQGAAQVAGGVFADGLSASIDTTQLADGVYTLRAHAETAGTRIDSEPRTIYVLNGGLSGTIAFRTLNEGQTLKGAATFDIGVEASPVPLTRVSWTITDANGQTIVTRSSINVGPVMQLSWNTKRWPNGNYIFHVTGDVGGQQIAVFSRGVKVKN